MTTTLLSLLPPSYGAVLLVVILQCLQCFAETFPIGSLRRRLFTVAFFEKNFPGVVPKPNKAGYPDTGYGRYADKLSHQDWLDFANAQRVHANLLESLPTIISLLLISGLTYPRVTVLLGLIYIFGRAVYGMGYRKGGPGARTPGTAIFHIGDIGLLISSIMSAVSIAGGVGGLTDFALSYLK